MLGVRKLRENLVDEEGVVYSAHKVWNTINNDALLKAVMSDKIEQNGNQRKLGTVYFYTAHTYQDHGKRKTFAPVVGAYAIFENFK